MNNWRSPWTVRPGQANADPKGFSGKPSRNFAGKFCLKRMFDCKGNL